jgi:hypothetical protein
MDSIKRSLELAERNPDLKRVLRETHEEIRDWYCIDLTHEQILGFYHEHPNIYSDAVEDFDTMTREGFIDVVCQDILGISWPCGGEVKERKGGEDKFFADLHEKAKEKGYKIVSE